MIPQSAGATPFGIFLLADEYLYAARSIPMGGRSHTNAPARLLAFHSCELFLKAYLRSHGQLVEQLRAYGHDLSEMLEAARACGLNTSSQIDQQLAKAQRENDYVQIRYLVVNNKKAMPVDKVLRLADNVRECVRVALNMDEFGNPLGELWAAPVPQDYLDAARTARPVRR